MKKGISPLVASVLLIAATMAIATVLTYWASSFVRTSLPSTANQTYGQCLASNFGIYSCSMVNTTSKATVTMILQNKGTTEIRNFTLLAFLNNGSISYYPLGGSLSPTISYAPFSATDVDWPYYKIVISTECPGIDAESPCQ